MKKLPVNLNTLYYDAKKDVLWYITMLPNGCFLHFDNDIKVNYYVGFLPYREEHDIEIGEL